MSPIRVILRMHKGNIDRLLAFGAASAENKRVAQDYLDGDQNSYKAISGFEAGLRDAEPDGSQTGG